MQFKVGDYVVHPIFRVGHIVKIEERKFTDQGTCLYYQITLPRRTLWIPIEAHEAVGLRLVTAKSELDQYRALLKSRPVALNQQHRQRHRELDDRLKEASFQVLCEVVRDLTAWSWQKPLGQSDKAILQKTRENLCQEWATAAGVSVGQALEEVDSLLQAAQQTFMGVSSS